MSPWRYWKLRPSPDLAAIGSIPALPANWMNAAGPGRPRAIAASFDDRRLSGGPPRQGSNSQARPGFLSSQRQTRRISAVISRISATARFATETIAVGIHLTSARNPFEPL